MCRETLHTHFDWIGTDTWAWIPNINTGIDNGTGTCSGGTAPPPPRIWARLRPCHLTQVENYEVLHPVGFVQYWWDGSHLCPHGLLDLA